MPQVSCRNASCDPAERTLWTEKMRGAVSGLLRGVPGGNEGLTRGEQVAQRDEQAAQLEKQREKQAENFGRRLAETEVDRRVRHLTTSWRAARSNGDGTPDVASNTDGLRVPARVPLWWAGPSRGSGAPG